MHADSTQVTRDRPTRAPRLTLPDDLRRDFAERLAAIATAWNSVDAREIAYVLESDLVANAFDEPGPHTARAVRAFFHFSRARKRVAELAELYIGVDGHARVAA